MRAEGGNFDLSSALQRHAPCVCVPFPRMSREKDGPVCPCVCVCACVVRECARRRREAGGAARWVRVGISSVSPDLRVRTRVRNLAR